MFNSYLLQKGIILCFFIKVICLGFCFVFLFFLIGFLLFLFLTFWPHHPACGILVPDQGSNEPASGVQSSPLDIREVFDCFLLQTIRLSKFRTALVYVFMNVCLHIQVIIVFYKPNENKAIFLPLPHRSVYSDGVTDSL